MWGSGFTLWDSKTWNQLHYRDQAASNVQNNVKMFCGEWVYNNINGFI